MDMFLEIAGIMRSQTVFAFLFFRSLLQDGISDPINRVNREARKGLLHGRGHDDPCDFCGLRPSSFAAFSPPFSSSCSSSFPREMKRLDLSC